jgi:AraC-like DNA-binding protein
MKSICASLPPPPPHAFCLRTDDLDQVREWTEGGNGPHTRVVHGAGPLGFEVIVLPGQLADIAWCRVGLAQTLRGAVPSACLQVPLSGGSRYRFGRRQLELQPGQAMPIAGGHEFTRDAEPGAMLGVQIKQDAWQSELRARRPELSPTAVPALQALPLGHASHASVRDALSALLEAALDPAPDLPRRALLEASLVSELVGVLDGDRRAGAARLTEQRLADLEDWIDAHLDESITLGRLCEVAGVGQRTLQQAFATTRGMSPMRFVTERRLAVARQRIERAAANETVAHIALGVGLPHLGRFAVQYRQAFGESPSMTLRRAVA